MGAFRRYLFNIMNAVRLLTPEAAAQIRYLYKRPMWIGFGTIFILAFGAQLAGWLGYWLFDRGFITGMAFATIVIYLDWYVHHRKVERAKEVYQFGDQITIHLVSISSNWGPKLNGAPQQVITINKGTELMKIKTFSGQVVQAFSPVSQPAYIFSKYPEILVPASIFSLTFYNPNGTSKPKTKIQSIDI